MFTHEKPLAMPVTVKARPNKNAAKQRCCGCTYMGKYHESATYSPDRQELESVIVDRHTGHGGTHSSSASGLVGCGWNTINGVLSATPNILVITDGYAAAYRER
jgi:hypothetical protein